MKIILITPRHIVLVKKGEYWIKLEKVYQSQFLSLPRVGYGIMLAGCSILGLMLYFWRWI